LTIIPFLSKFICFATQSRNCAGAQFSNKQQKSSYQNYFLQADFSLSEKLHLETGLAFNTTRYSGSFAAAETIQTWPIPGE
jgi:iron complex outermembrane receptor protein